MAAVDTFDWYVRTLKDVDAKTLQFIRDQRGVLYSLRSEDERQRFVEELIEELRQRAANPSNQ